MIGARRWKQREWPHARKLRVFLVLFAVVCLLVATLTLLDIYGVIPQSSAVLMFTGGVLGGMSLSLMFFGVIGNKPER